MPLYAIQVCLFAVSSEDAKRAFDALNAKLGPVRGFNTITEDCGGVFRVDLEAVELRADTVDAAKAVAKAVVDETLGARQPAPMVGALTYGNHTRLAPEPGRVVEPIDAEPTSGEGRAAVEALQKELSDGKAAREALYALVKAVASTLPSEQRSPEVCRALADADVVLAQRALPKAGAVQVTIGWEQEQFHVVTGEGRYLSALDLVTDIGLDGRWALRDVLENFADEQFPTETAQQWKARTAERT